MRGLCEPIPEGRARPGQAAPGWRRPLAGLALAAALAAALPATAATPVPALTGPVVDEAGLLGRADVERLSSLARAARAAQGGQGVQLQYLLVRSLEGEAIEDYSIRVAEAWKLGTRGADNGVLVTVAVQDRQVRIEVGGGLEGGLTDAQSSRIIRGTVVPAFRAGRFGDGLYDAGVQILGALPTGVSAPRPQRPVTHLSSLAVLLLFVAVFVFRVLAGFGPRRRRSLWWGGGPWGGGPFGGGGFGGGDGGGGWSGGGGGFSGGGASGRW